MKPDANSGSRSLAFEKTSSVLKSFTTAVTHIDQLTNIKDIGTHSLAVIQEVLEAGTCAEIEQTVRGEWYRTMTLFMSVFGVGKATAQKWFDRSLRTLVDVVRSSGLPLRRSSQIAHGLEFFDDLNAPVTIEEARAIIDLVMEHVNVIMR